MASEKDERGNGRDDRRPRTPRAGDRAAQRPASGRGGPRDRTGGTSAGGRGHRDGERGRDDRRGVAGGRAPAREGGRGPSRDGRRDSADRRPARPVPTSDARRERADEPALPDDITPRDLASAARNELKTLSKENAETVARHLAMAARLIDDDPALAHAHALAATRRAGRVAVVRETAAITAYAIGDFALALRELRTYRRISGRDDQLPLMVDSERGVGRADRALEVGRSVDRMTLDPAVRVELAIAMSGARLDLGETERALRELDIPELDPDRAFEWSPALFAARATVLEELGRDDEAEQWFRRAEVAADALDAASGAADREVVVVEELGDDASDDTASVPLPVDGDQPERP